MSQSGVRGGGGGGWRRRSCQIRRNQRSLKRGIAIVVGTGVVGFGFGFRGRRGQGCC